MAVTIGAEGLVKRYGEQRALDEFDLEVDRGMVFGLLGPNGAGKTTAVRSFATLLRYDAGNARVAGRDPATEPHEVRRRIGLSGQTPAVDEILGGRQNLVLFGRLNRMTRRDAQRRADELLGQFGLADAAEKQVKHYSGGMRRRLDLAVTLLLRPEVLFLDEPTTGLDPRNRTEVWEAVRSLAADGTTVLLTTQYLDEADQLAGRVAVMEAGKVIAEGTPDELKRGVGGDQLEVVVEESAQDGAHLDALELAREVVARYGAGPPHVDRAQRRVSAPVDDRVAAMAGVLRDLQQHRVPIADVALRKPTLDDVFLRLTGHAAEAETTETADTTETGKKDEG
jgi:ABC-2 type transport system ATP-binding protein